MFQHIHNNINYLAPIILSSAIGDVNGDRVPDNVYLTGVKTTDSPFIQKITLVIQDGQTGLVNYVPLKSDSGYKPTLFLGDFTGNKVDDIFISIASGGSGGIMYYYIYSYLNNKPSLLFDYNIFNDLYKYKVTYENYYKVKVTNTTLGTEFIIDISNREKSYLDEIYDSGGKLKAPIEGFVSPLSGLYPVDYDSDGVYELLAYQRISGQYAADALGYVQTIMKWNHLHFTLVDQFVAILGNKVKALN